MGSLEGIKRHFCLCFPAQDGGKLVEGPPLCTIQCARCWSNWRAGCCHRSRRFSLPLGFTSRGCCSISRYGTSPGTTRSHPNKVRSLSLVRIVFLTLDRLILTPISLPKRSLIHSIRILPSYFCPPTLMIPTILHSLITPTINHSTPLLLRSHLSIDPVLTPTTYSFFKFLSRTVELFLKLPLETVLRRGQMSVLASTLYRLGSGNHYEPMVPIGPFKGTMGTMWSIVKDEGTSSHEVTVGTKKKAKTVERKGQGIGGLWRGWRVGMWGLVGVWGARAMGGGGSSGGEF